MLTWVQGATANWLLLRYMHALLGNGSGGGDGEENEVAGVVLVSFLRDARFWAESCTRLVSFTFFYFFVSLLSFMPLKYGETDKWATKSLELKSFRVSSYF